MDKVTKEQRAVITWLVWYLGDRTGTVEAPTINRWELDLVEEVCREGFDYLAQKLEGKFDAPDLAKNGYRVQFENQLGPDARVFDTEQEAAAYATANWPEGGWWVISEE